MYRIEINEVLLVNSITIIIGTLGYHRDLIFYYKTGYNIVKLP